MCCFFVGQLSPFLPSHQCVTPPKAKKRDKAMSPPPAHLTYNELGTDPITTSTTYTRIASLTGKGLRSPEGRQANNQVLPLHPTKNGDEKPL
jgi:hypothetical protein